MSRSLTDMVVVITGASAGIGRQLAIDLHARGAKLALAARRIDRLHELNQQLGGGHLVVECDVSRTADCERLIAESVARFGRIDTLVANAGYGISALVHEMRPEQVDHMLRTNVCGTIDCIRAAVPIMSKQDRRFGVRGQIMIVSSAAARRGLPYFGLYSATKAAQLSLAEALRVELRSLRIAVTSVHPIGTETDFFRTAEALGNARIESPMRTSYRQPVEHVSRRMIRAIEKPAREVWPARSFRWLLALTAVAPAGGDWWMKRAKREIDEMNAR